ncbi:MAG: beta-ketoacyl-ACP synthase II [Firmicutes bacterium]|nr:beta-ketoacyl-ACP synthase II [Bacillota bacterium]
MERRVVITGMGAVTPIGNNVEQFWDGLKSGRNGIDFIKNFDTTDFKVKVAGEVKDDFDPLVAVDKKDLKRMDRFTVFAMVAADEAVKSSGIDLEKIDKDRLGVVIGSGIGGLPVIEEATVKLVEKGPSKIGPLCIPMTIGNMAAGQVAIKYQAKGTCIDVVTACASSTNCIGEAFRNIKHGYSDYIIAGGAEATVCPLGIGGFTSLKALSTNNDPKRSSMPFDKERNGFVMGEGAGIVFMESLESAQARGAKILAEVVGYGSTCDAYHMTSPLPDGTGAAKAMTAAMREAGIESTQVDYINAHGTSTHLNDAGETAAIKIAFGEEQAKKISISSTKSMTGHLLGATGAVEVIATALAMQHGIIPPTINYQVPDEECDLDYTPNKAVEREVKYALSNTFGFGGHNAVLCLKKWEG